MFRNRALKVSVINDMDTDAAVTETPRFTKDEITEIIQVAGLVVITCVLSYVVADTARQGVVKSVPTR